MLIRSLQEINRSTAGIQPTRSPLTCGEENASIAPNSGGIVLKSIDISGVLEIRCAPKFLSLLTVATLDLMLH
jgi:hypothetical protein